MKPSTTKNRTFYGKSVTFVEVGDTLFFGGDLQQFHKVTHITGSRPFAGDIDLFNLSKKEQPINFTENEFGQ